MTQPQVGLPRAEAEFSLFFWRGVVFLGVSCPVVDLGRGLMKSPSAWKWEGGLTYLPASVAACLLVPD